MIRAKKKKREKIHCWPKRETFAPFLFSSSFSNSSFFFFLLSKSVLSKGSDTNHLHLNVNLNTGDICVLNVISD